MTLTKETVCNIKNAGTKTFISTQFQKDDGTADVEEDQSEEDVKSQRSEDGEESTGNASKKKKTLRPSKTTFPFGERESSTKNLMDEVEEFEKEQEEENEKRQLKTL